MVSHEPHDEGFIKFIYTRGMTFPHIFQVSEYSVTLYTIVYIIIHASLFNEFIITRYTMVLHTIPLLNPRS